MLRLGGRQSARIHLLGSTPAQEVVPAFKRARIDLHEREQQSKRRRRRGAVARQAVKKPQAQPRAPEPVPASADPAAAAVSGDIVLAERWVTGSEFTVAILHDVALPVIRIVTDNSF